jgi:protein translocase SecG subunit
MSLLIGFLTFILVVNCLLLVLLVLIQLPKKEAGAGLAFGGGATDALFGAGSGNALTKMTKYAAGTFLLLALILTVLNTKRAGSSVRLIEAELARRAASNSAPATIPPMTPMSTNQGLRNISNSPAGSPATNLLSPLPPATTNSGATQPAAPAGTQPTTLPGQQSK